MSAEDLATFVETVCSESHLRVQEDLGDGFVRLRSEEAQRRQAAHDIRSSEDAVIEILRNARDAEARNIFLATCKEGEKRLMVMVDDGVGIPPKLHSLIFEPRVTSKLDTVHMDKWGVHGRGMALYSIKENSLEARVVASEPGRGSSILVRTDTSALAERTDQSTFPQLAFGETGKVSIRGPRNIVRTACEFALEHRKTLNVFLGSPVEIAATLYQFGLACLPASRLAFSDSKDQVPFAKTLAYAADPTEFVAAADALGLQLSDRSAYRIMQGQLKPLDSLLDCLERQGVAGNAPEARKPSPKPARAAGPAKVALSPELADQFAADVQKAFSAIAEAYYLDPQVSVEVKVERGSLKAIIPLVQDE
ncbi:MAG: ATP-binding protein [Coriobacteriia bacterium]|nr:ATP-binding protein [Coriobacteriia bacterium]